MKQLRDREGQKPQATHAHTYSTKFNGFKRGYGTGKENQWEGTERAEKGRAALSQIHSSMEFPNKTYNNKSNKYTLKIRYFELVISEKYL